MNMLSEVLQSFMQRAEIGTQTLSKLTGIPRSSIENWCQGIAGRPRHWRSLLQIGRVLLLTSAEVEALLAAASYPALATLAHDLSGDDPDWQHLPSWLAAPVVSAPAPPAPLCHQLRAPVPDFVGRSEAISTLLRVLRTAADSGAVAAISGVRGMGGVGKTELAYYVAQQLDAAFPDGQIVVFMQGTSSQPLPIAQALRTVISAFTPNAKLPDEDAALQAHYCNVLHKKQVLILADDALNSAQVQPLRPPAGCALLITSRQRFSLEGMTVIDLEQLEAEAAVRLVRNICGRLRIEEAKALAQACGCLPLALRVSASMLCNDPALPVADYLAQLRDERRRFTQLRDPDNSGLDVGASLALSYQWLERDAQLVFRQLGVLLGDFDTGLALSVVAAPGDVDVEATLRLLLRRNLVMYDAERGRWRLHDLVRDVARQRLEAMGEAEAAQWRYARAAVVITQQVQEQYLAGGDRALLALSRFDAERAHIDAARRWAQLHTETPAGDQLLLDSARATRSIEQLRYNPRHELIPLWEAARMAAQRLGDLLEAARALANLGIAYFLLGELHMAITYYEQTLATFRELGDRRGEGNALHNLGGAYKSLGDAREAICCYEQTIAITREIGDRRSEGKALGNLGNVYTELGEPSKAINCYEQTLAIAREIGDRRGEGITFSNLGMTYTDLGETQRAIVACEEALAISRDIGDRRSEGYALSYLARAQAIQGEMARASSTYAQAVTLLQEVGDRWGEAECQWLFGLALAQQGQQEEALPLLLAAVVYEQEIGHMKAAEHAALITHLAGNHREPATGGPASPRRGDSFRVDAVGTGV